MTFSPAVEFFAALRRLLRTPAFSLGVIALLAVSIGGAAAVATAGYSLFLRPLPYQQPEQLVSLSVFSKSFGVRMGLSPALVNDLVSSSEFGRIAIVDQAFDLELESGALLRAASMDHHLVHVLGLPLRAGRLFGIDDVQPGAEPIALISEVLALEKYGSLDAAIDQRIDTKSNRLRIVGVLPSVFAMPESAVDVWLPIELGPEELHANAFSRFGNLLAIARLADGETLESISARLQSRLGQDTRLAGFNERLQADYQVRPLHEIWTDGEAEALIILGLAIGLVLVIAILNLAGLWVSRWLGLSQELAIRLAIGGRSRQLLASAGIEFLLLALPAALLAFPVAAVGIAFLFQLEILDDNGPLTVAPGTPTGLIAALIVMLAALAILSSLIWQIRQVAVSTRAYFGGGGVAVRTHGARLRQLLMVFQIAFAFSLLLVLGLLFSSWKNLLGENLGFDHSHLVALHIIQDRPKPGESPGPLQIDSRAAQLIEVLAELPGVSGVSWSNAVPFGQRQMLSTISLDGGSGAQVPVQMLAVGPEYFSIAGIELLQGRRFGLEDKTEKVQHVIVDEQFSIQYLGGDALGKSLGMGSSKVTIVGIVDSVRHNSPGEISRTPALYTYSHEPIAQVQLLLRAAIAPDALIETVRERAIDVLGAERVSWIASLESLVRRSVDDREPQLLLLSVFASFAFVLVLYGLYALQSYQVAARTAEFGLRKAMGASGRHMLALVLGHSLRLLVPGLVLGAAGGWLGARLVAERLYAVSLVDPLLWSGVALAVSAVIAIATFVPALRAVRVAPMEALRHE